MIGRRFLCADSMLDVLPDFGMQFSDWADKTSLREYYPINKDLTI